jgi:hypothetical protein
MQRLVSVVALTFACILATSPIVVPAADVENLNNLSGFATIALFQAYEASGLAHRGPPAFNLAPYYVTITFDSGTFQIWFLAQTDARTMAFFIEGKTGRLIWKSGDKSARPRSTDDFPHGYVLPGIIVGEIVTAFQRGEVDHLALRDASAFDTSYQPLGGGTDVYFEPLSASPQTPAVTTASASGSRPLGCDKVCLRQYVYAVRTMGGVVTVRRGDEVIRVHI